MSNKVNKIWMMAMICVLSYLVIAYIVVSSFDANIHMTDRTLFYTQTGVTLLTVMLIPAALWYVRRERFDDVAKYAKASVVRIAVFGMLAFICCVLYVLTSGVSFFYLGVITFIAMVFARGEKTDTDSH